MLLALSLALAAPEDASPDAPRSFPEALETGTVTVGDGLATLKLPEHIEFLTPKNATFMLEEVWGNPHGLAPLGMLMPEAEGGGVDPSSWGVVIQYDSDGHVSDSDADAIDYDDLLAEMKESTVAESAERVKAGFSAIELLGWARSPTYDKVGKKLHWAKLLKFSDTAQTMLNYDVRVLGREGVLVLTAVAGADELSTVDEAFGRILPIVEFNSGHTYGEFDASTDRVAEYGLAALVAGGVAAKTGLLKGLLALLLAGKKFVILALAGAAGALKRLFGGGKAPPPEQTTDR